MKTSKVLLAALCVAMTFGARTPLAAGRARVDVATLKKIASKVDGRAGTVSIEASEPVPYVASQPDPRQFVIELRDTVSTGFADSFKPDPRHPVSAVQVEQGQAADGATVTRIRMSLAQPMRPRVRSSRNVIFVEADRLDRIVAGPPSAGPALPAPTQQYVGRVPPQADPPSAQGPLLQLAAAQAAPPAAPAQAPPPAAPATATQGPAPAPGTTPSRFTGFPVSLDFQGADLRAVLRTFAEISGLNIVIDPSINGTVDVALRDVPWDQAMDIILRSNKLGYSVDGTIVRIVPLTVLADEEAQRQKLADAQALAGQLQTLTRTLSYSKADTIVPLIKDTVLSQRGSVTTDARTNTLIVTDLAERLARASDLLNILDRPEPQVEIEARIIQTTRDYAQRLGVAWGFTGRADPALGNTLPVGFPNQVNAGGRTGGNSSGVIAAGDQRTQGPTTADAASTAVSLGVGAATSGVGLALGAINGAFNLDVALSALESSGNGRVLSTPRVTTQNNIAANIEQGVQIPIQTVANNTVTVTFRPASLRLSVTPQITASNTVIMRIEVANESPDFSRAVNGIPPIDSQNAVTQVLVNNGETTVIGGIYVSREQSTQDRTPALYRIPLLGWLFQRNQVTDESRELLIFITPRIIRL